MWRSTTGFCTFLGSNCISWSASKQPIVSCSNFESDFRAMASTAAELTWISFILHDIGFTKLSRLFYSVIIFLLFICLWIRFYMLERSTFPFTITLSKKRLLLATSLPNLFLHLCKLWTCSPNHYHMQFLLVLRPNLGFGTLPCQVWRGVKKQMYQQAWP